MMVKPLYDAQVKVWFLSGLFLFLVMFSAGALAQTYNGDSFASQDKASTVNRLNRLENEVETLGRAVYRGDVSGAPMPPVGAGDAQAQADVQLKVQQLEVELRSLNGQLEEKDHAIRQLQKQFDKRYQDLLLRVQDLEAGRGGMPSSSQSTGKVYTNPKAEAAVSVKADPAVKEEQGPVSAAPSSLGQLSASGEAVKRQGATESYESAFSLLKQGRYNAAQKGFEAFLAVYPSHQLAGNAQYWLGETHYVRGQYEPAARIFAQGFKDYPKGSKAPDNLLKLGITLAAMGKKADACVALSQVEKEFSAGAQSVLRRAKLEMERLGCGG